MTKPELQTKHPSLVTAETAAIFADVANHMRRGSPNVPANVPLDATMCARHLGIKEGFQMACEYLNHLHEPERAITPQPTREHYQNPNPNPQQS